MLSIETAELAIHPSLPEFLSLRIDSGRIPIVAQKRVPGLNPFQLYKKLFEDCTTSFLLESGKGPENIARYSFFGNTDDSLLMLDLGKRDSLEALLKNLQFNPNGPEFAYAAHFWGGWLGFFSYEAIQYLESIQFKKKDEMGLPDVCLVKTRHLLVYDHIQEILKCIVSVPGESPTHGDYQDALDILDSLWDRIDGFPGLVEEETPGSIKPRSAGNGFHSSMTRETYTKAVEKARHYIEEGDVYQANLAQRFQIDNTQDPLDLYQELRQLNPSPFGGVFKFDDTVIVSSSPERLIKIDKGWIETRPIAGTRPRGSNSCEDSRLSEELLLNQKERAEHLMLVDLERNDLGRVCEYGTVHVSDFMFREEYSHVHHIVSNIVGKLKPGLELADILRAVFPGGTITGCPKIRCMEIIEELEPTRRGPYCGSLGYIGYGPYLDLNILIRTILVKNNTAWFHAGAGIVADSIPENEYEETLNKAAALMQVLSGNPA